MTAQAMECLIINGEPYGMAAEPLESYINSLEKKPSFPSMITSCKRCYTGTWEIIEDRLFLVHFKTYDNRSYKVDITTEESSKKPDMCSLFPGQDKVFAAWFSGEVRLPKGEMINYVHGGYDSE